MKINCGLAIGIFYCSVLLFSCRSIKPEHPDTSDEAVPNMQEQPASQLSIDMSINLGKYFQKAEEKVPAEHSGGKQDCEGLSYSYYFKRMPLVLEGKGTTVTGRIEGKYKLESSYCLKCLAGNCIHPRLKFSCGTEDEGMRTLKIAYSVSLGITPEYNLQSKTKLIELQAGDKRCVVSPVNIDITEQIIEQLKDPLNTLASKADQALENIELREHVEKIWKTVTGGLKLGNYGYLYFNPEHVKLSSFELKDSILNFSLITSAKPTIRTDSLPHKEFPLPKLTEYAPSNKGFDAYVDLNAGYDSLSNYLTKYIAGTTITIKKRKFTIVSAAVTGMGNGKLIAAIRFKGYKRGTIYLIGTPYFDKATHELSIPDCDFDVKTKAILLKLAKWMYNDKIVNLLREKTKFNIAEYVNISRKKIEEEMNRRVGKHKEIEVEASLKELHVEGIYPLKDKLILRASSKGNLSIKVTPVTNPAK